MKSTSTSLAVVTTSNGPNFLGAGSPSMRARNVAEALLSRDQTMVWLNSTPIATSSLLNDRHEAAKDHALAVERHGVLVRLYARVAHERLHALVAHLARRPNDPREDYGLVGLALHRHRKRCHLTLGDIIAPTFNHLESAVVLEDVGRRFSMLLELLKVCRGNRSDESIDIGHGIAPVAVVDWRCFV